MTRTDLGAERLLAADVSVWVVRVDDARWLDTAVLSVDEQRRGDRFVRADLRRSYVVAHSALRHLLASYVGSVPARLRFARRPCHSCGGAHGKPVLVEPAGCGVDFNLSHSGDLAAIAVAPAREVGVDVEQVRLADPVALARRFFNPVEQAFVAHASSPSRRLAFARLWSRKEAYLKAVGSGLAGGLDSIEVPGWSWHGEVGSAPHRGSWTIADLDLGTEYAGAVAASGTNWRVEVTHT